MIFVTVSSLTGAQILRLGDVEFGGGGAQMRKGLLENLSFNVRDGNERQRYSDERDLPDDLIFMSLRRYCGSEE